MTALLRDRLINDRECARLTSLSRTTRWRLQRNGLFPKAKSISPGRVAYLESEILAWVNGTWMDNKMAA